MIHNRGEFEDKVEKLGENDSRKIIHSFKVGITLALVSLLFYFSLIYGGFKSATMCGTLTIIVVFEFSVGATLGKGLNRAIATFLGGALGIGVHHLANLAGKGGEPILLGAFVFLLAVIKLMRYHKLLFTILIGCLICVMILVFIFYVWVGEDLKKLTCLNLENLGDFLETFGREYYCFQKDESILNSKTAKKSFVNFTRWVPPHGKFRYGYPWKQFLEIGRLTRQCAYRIEALTNSIKTSQTQLVEFNKVIQKDCMEMESTNIFELMPILQVITLLMEVIGCIENIVDSVNELSHIAKFQGSETRTCSDDYEARVVITVCALSSAL
ncbi:hypothetical protein MKX01_011013 [Papaver californicum]|nr:hypothetical protein MKX01_011013 [Papaver californicum]